VERRDLRARARAFRRGAPLGGAGRPGGAAPGVGRAARVHRARLRDLGRAAAAREPRVFWPAAAARPARRHPAVFLAPRRAAAPRAPAVAAPRADGRRRDRRARTRRRAADPPVLEQLSRGATGWWQADRQAPPRSGRPSPRVCRHAGTASAPSPCVRPRGAARAVRAVGTGWWLRGSSRRWASRSNAPVSSADRQALAFWESPASAVLRSLSVGGGRPAWPGAVRGRQPGGLGAGRGGEARPRRARRSNEADSRGI
jgi:hypothetical protein